MAESNRGSTLILGMAAVGFALPFFALPSSVVSSRKPALVERVDESDIDSFIQRIKENDNKFELSFTEEEIRELEDRLKSDPNLVNRIQESLSIAIRGSGRGR